MKQFLKLSILFYFIVGGFLPIAFAQNEEPKDTTDEFIVDDETPALAQAYTLEQCIEHALEYSEELKKSDIDRKIAEETVRETISTGLPQLNAYVSYLNNLKIQQIFVPDGSIFGGPPGPAAVAFNTQHNGQAYFRLSQLVFSRSFLIGLDAAKAYTKLAPQQKKITEVDIVENVSKAFFSTLVNQERLELINNNVQRLDTILRETLEMYKNGFAEKIDVMRLEVQHNNLKTEQKKLKELIAFSKDVLKFQMGMPVRDLLSIVGSLDNINLEDKSILFQNSDATQRPEYELFETQKFLQGLSLKNEKAQYTPTVTAFMDYGWNTGVNQMSDFVKFRDFWFNYNTVGINVNIPILAGFEKKHKLQKAQFEIDKIKQDQEAFERAVDFQAQQAKTNLVNAMSDLEIQEKNMELAEEVARVARIKFANGVGTNLEIINAEADYKEAETNYYDALYNAIISKIDLQKALGTLHQ